jgi:copper transport protein
MTGRAAPVRRRLVVVLLFLGTLLGAGLLLAGSASAHASVVSTDPADGSRLASAPQTVTVSFDEQVGLGAFGYLHVTDQAGRRVDTGDAYHPGGDGTKIANRLRAGLGAGTYTESYRIVSAYSHPVAAVLRFVVGNGVLSAAVGGVGATTDTVTSIVFDLARWVSYAGFALLGGLWLPLTVWPGGRDDRRARAIVWAGWTATVVGAVTELVLQGPDAAGTGLSGIRDWSLLDGTLHTDYGQFHCARLLLLAALAIMIGSALQPDVRRQRTRFELLAAPLLVGVAVTFSLIGHAATTDPAWLSEAADVVHLCAMAAWIGGLAMLLGAVLPRRDAEELRPVLPVFSRVAFGAVIAIAITGTYAAWRGIGVVRAILTTEYGLLVVAKVALFGGLLALGNLSRRAIQRRTRRMAVAYAMTEVLEEHESQPPDDPAFTERLRRSVLVEIAIAVLVLAATAVLVDQPRGSEALAISARQPVTGTATLTAGRTVSVTVDPGQHGTVAASVALSSGTQPTEVTATATQPAKQLGPIPIPLTAEGRDLYAASGIDLPVAGRWVITLVVTTSDFNAVTTDVALDLN